MNHSGVYRRWKQLACAWLGCCALLVAPAFSQDAEERPAEMLPRTSRPAVQESSASPIRLLDQDGKLVPVPGVSLEEFLRIFQREKPPVGSLAPVGTIEELTITGKVIDNRVECSVSMRARVQGNGWCTIPVRMGRMVLRAAPKYSDIQQVLRWEETGYVWQIKGSEKTEAQINFDAFLLLSTVGDETRFAATLPRANAATLELQVPGKSMAAVLRGGEGIVTSSSEGNSTAIQVIGGSGEFQLGWHRVNNPSDAPVALLESSGDILVKVEGKSHVSSEARLKVRSFGEPVSSFRVRLPPGMELLPFSSPGYTVEVVEDLPRGMAATADQLAKSSQLVEVKLDRPAAGVAEVRLVANLVPDEKRTSPIEPARFQIEGAVRQRGTLDAVVDGDWSLQWTEDSSVRRVDAIVDTASAVRHTARFEYFRQPCGLKMNVVPRPTRVHVEPTYVIFLDKHRMRLEATLKYRIRGARTAQLSVDLGAWNYTSIGPDSLVEVDPGEIKNGTVVINSLQPGGAAGTLDLKLEAQLPVGQAGERIEFTLPRPPADVVAPATVVVVPADNMELTLDPKRMQGLAADALSASVPLPPSQLPPLVFRDLGGTAAARFAADVKLQARRTTASSTANVRVGRRTIEVEQRLRYLVQYEPQSRFDWWVPKQLVDGVMLQVTDDTLQPVTLIRVPADELSTNTGSPPPSIVDKPKVDVGPAATGASPASAASGSAGTTPEITAPTLPTNSQPSAAGASDTPGAPAPSSTLTPTASPTPPDKSEENGWVRCRVETVSSVVGPHEFILRYTLDVPPIDSVLRPVVEASFVYPITDAPLATEGLRLTVTQAEDLQVEPTSATVLRWERVSRKEFRGVLPIERQKVGLRIIPLERPRTPGIMVHRLLVQTWLTTIDRADRAVFRLTAADTKVRFRLPAGAGTSALKIAIDGHEVANWGLTDREEVVVDIPPDKLNQESVVEFWYDFPQGRPMSNWWNLPLDAPAVVGASSVRQLMWEVVSGADMHLLVDPVAYVPEMNWQWQGAYFGRRASLSQLELEDWAGASHQSPLPEAANHYLFHSFGRSPQLQLWMIRRRWLILLASASVLACGLALTYFKPLRSPASLLVLGLLLVCGALIAPEMTVLVGQAAVAGLLATALAVLLRSFFRPTVPKPNDISRRVRSESSLIQPQSIGSQAGRRPLSTTAAAAAGTGLVSESGP